MASYSSAKELLNAVVARYRAMEKYADSGHVRLQMKGNDHFLYFQTARGEGGDFRFSFDCPHPYRPLRHKVRRHVVGRCEGRSYLLSGWSSGQTLDLPESFGRAIAGATGISGGAAHTIASLMFEEVGGWSFADLKRPRLRSITSVDGVDCYRVTGLQGRLPVTLFVGMGDLIIRKLCCRKLRTEEVRFNIDTSTGHAREYFHVPRAEVSPATRS